MIKYALLFTFTITNIVFANEKDSNHLLVKYQKNKRILQREITTIEGLKNIDSKLKLMRILFLKSELIKIERQREERIYIKSKNKDKSKHFQKSQQLKRKVEKEALNLIKKLQPKGKEKLYYLIALNDREYGKRVNTLKWLRKAMYYSKLNKNLSNDVTIALVEELYIQKEYKETIPLFKMIVSDKKNKWLSKYLYNYAWALYKSNQKEDAIKRLIESYEVGKQDNFIKFEDDVIKSLIIFQVREKEIKTLLSFFKKENIQNKYYLLLLENSSEQLKFADIRKIISEISKRKLNEKEKMAFIHLKFTIYKKHKKYKQFAMLSLMMTSLNLNVFNTEIINLIKELTYYHLDTNKSLKIIKYANTQLNTLIKIDSKNKSEYYQQKADLYLSLEKYLKALLFFKKSIATYNLSKNKNKVEKIFNNYFFCARKLESNDKYFLWGFNQFIKLWPRSEKTKPYYYKLFKYYIKNNQIDKAFELSLKTHKTYPQSVTYNSKINAELTLLAIKNKNKHVLLLIYTNRKLLKITKMEEENLIFALGALTFDKIEINKSLSLHERKENYKKLYKNLIYPKAIRRKSFKSYLNLASQNLSVQSLKRLIEDFNLLYHKKDLINERYFFYNIAFKYINQSKNKNAFLILSNIKNISCDDWNEKIILLESIIYLRFSDYDQFYKQLTTKTNCLLKKTTHLYLTNLFFEDIFINSAYSVRQISNKFTKLIKKYSSIERNILEQLIYETERNLDIERKIKIQSINSLSLKDEQNKRIKNQAIKKFKSHNAIFSKISKLKNLENSKIDINAVYIKQYIDRYVEEINNTMEQAYTYFQKYHNKHKFTAFQSRFLKGRYNYLNKVLPEKINEFLSNKKSSKNIDISTIQNLALELIRGNENIVFLDPLQEKNIFLNESRLAHKTIIMNRP